MSDTNHPADLLADDLLAYGMAGPGCEHDRDCVMAARELRRIPALEAERDALRAEVTRWSTTAAVIEAERNELRAEVQALREDANMADRPT